METKKKWTAEELCKKFADSAADYIRELVGDDMDSFLEKHVTEIIYLFMEETGIEDESELSGMPEYVDEHVDELSLYFIGKVKEKFGI